MDPDTPMQRIRRAWVLNLDADLELGSAGPAYTPSRSVVSAMRAWRNRIAPTLLSPGDVLVDEDTPPGSARGLVGRAFCPTPGALSLLERSGAKPEAHPSAAVLRRVNGRGFCASLGETLAGAVFVTNEAEAREKLTSSPPAGSRGWRIKRAFAMAGRAQRVISVDATTGRTAVSREDWDFVRASLGQGEGCGLRIEPDVAVATEYAMHGVLAPDGSLVLGEIVTQRCDARGAWIASERLPACALASFPFAHVLEEEARRVARSLYEAGYFGPFGIDAFTYRDPGGDVPRPGDHLRFNPRSEINARYSMGFSVGFGRDRVPRA